jgi:uncharacterized protein
MLSRLAQCFAGALLCFLALLPPAWAQNLVPVPALKARVTDLTGSLSADQLTRLEQKLAAFESRKGSQFAVLIVATTHPETIEQYSIHVAEQWKLGRKDVDDGALLLVAKDDRAVRIEVGYGLEGALPDAIAKRIIEDIIVPRFKSGDFYGGIDAGVDAMIKVVEGEPLPPAREQGHAGGSEGDSGNSLLLFTVGIFVVIALAMVLRAVLGRLPAAVLIGGAAGVIVWLLVSSLAAAAAAGLLAFVFTLFGGTAFGGYGGWGSSGGVGGGFGGGGGGFGGGGASGRW